MNAKCQIYTLGLCLVFLIAFVSLLEFRKARLAATLSTVSSIQAKLQELRLADAFPLEPKWVTLDDSEHDRFMQQLLADGNIDQGSSGMTNEGFFADPWGNRFQVAARKNKQNKVEWKVWSTGPDGLPGSNDDIGTK